MNQEKGETGKRNIELELEELLYEYYEEHPYDVPDIEEFAAWLYEKVVPY